MSINHYISPAVSQVQRREREARIERTWVFETGAPDPSGRWNLNGLRLLADYRGRTVHLGNHSKMDRAGSGMALCGLVLHGERMHLDNVDEICKRCGHTAYTYHRPPEPDATA